jgi:arylformamidase
MVIHDISQTLCREVAVWPGDPEFRSRRPMKLEEGESSNVSAIDMCVHTGTHIDAPLHLDNSGSDIASIPLHHFIGNVRVFSIPAEKCIRLSDLLPLDWQNVERALFKTRSSDRPENAFDSSFVFLDESAAGFLTQKGLLLVGTDAPSVDAFDSPDLPSHRILLSHGIAILEGARLESVSPGDYELICIPLKLAGLEGSPVRAILRK